MTSCINHIINHMINLMDGPTPIGGQTWGQPSEGEGVHFGQFGFQ